MRKIAGGLLNIPGLCLNPDGWASADNYASHDIHVFALPDPPQTMEQRENSMPTLVDNFVSEMLDHIKRNRLQLPILPDVAFRVRETVE